MSKQAAGKLIIVLLPIILFLGLLWNYLTPFGEKTVSMTVGENSPFIQRLLPDERVKDGVIIDEPVYFSVTPPAGNFTSAHVKVTFKTGEKSILELGALKDLFTQAFDFRPLANTVLSNLEKDGWVSENASKIGKDVKVFFRNETVMKGAGGISDGQIVVYKASLPWSPPKDLTRGILNKNTKTDIAFRGSQEFFVYKEERGSSLLGPLSYTDINEVEGADDVTLTLYAENGEVAAAVGKKDDGNVSKDGKRTEEITFEGGETLLDGLPSGVYRAVFSATSDIVVNGFETPTRYFSFKHTVTVASDDVTLQTNAKEITIEPLTSEALGTLSFGGKEVTLSSVGEKVSVQSSGEGISTLSIPKREGEAGQYKVTGDGFFSPSEMLFFAAEPAGFSNFVSDPDAYNIVVAQVPNPETDGEWQMNGADFDLTTLAKENGAYKFSFSVPFVDEEGGGAEIHSITVTFKKPSSISEVLKELKHFVKLLFT
jgi:hypothetical protein